MIFETLDSRSYRFLSEGPTVIFHCSTEQPLRWLFIRVTPMKTAISTESSISSASNSSCRECLLTLATRAGARGYSPASTAINPESTARRSAGAIRA